MNRARLSALRLSALLLLLTACQGRFVPSASAPVPSPTPAPTVSQPSAAGPPAPSEAPQPPAVSPAEYQAMACALNADIQSESQLLLRMGLYEYNWWVTHAEDPGGPDLTAMRDELAAWLAQTHAAPEAVADAHHRLSASYAALVYAEVDGGLSPDLPARASALFAAYHQLYLTVTQPSGTAPEFARMLCSCDYSITSLSAGFGSSL